jgi:D-amino acid aminotransferase
MEGYVYLNGAIVRADESTISPFDRGFLYGDGLFETMRAYGGTVHLLRRHIVRLQFGAELLKLQLPAERELRDAIRLLLEANRARDVAVRLTVSRGALPQAGQDSTPTIFANLRPLDATRGADRLEALATVKTPRMLPETAVRLKSLNYLSSALAMQEVAAAGASEGIMLTPDGCVAEGSVSNLFFVKDRMLLTPPIELGILPGITRQRVIELAGERGVEVRETRFTVDEMKRGDECFYTNSVREIVPVSTIDNERIGSGEVGTITRRLVEAYRHELPDEEL